MTRPSFGEGRVPPGPVPVAVLFETDDYIAELVLG